jgi:hypothetical protein
VADEYLTFAWCYPPGAIPHDKPRIQFDTDGLRLPVPKAGRSDRFRAPWLQVAIGAFLQDFGSVPGEDTDFVPLALVIEKSPEEVSDVDDLVDQLDELVDGAEDVRNRVDVIPGLDSACVDISCALCFLAHARDEVDDRDAPDHPQPAEAIDP